MNYQYQFEDNFKAQANRESVLRKINFLNDDFEPTIRKVSRTIDIDLGNIYRAEKHLVRKSNLKAQPVLVAKDLESLQTEIRDVEKLIWWQIWKTKEKRFQAKPVLINGNNLIQLIDEKNGKLTYISPPETDRNGKKISRSKRYVVTVVVNYFTKSREFIFTPQEIIQTTQEENELILKNLAESI